MLEYIEAIGECRRRDYMERGIPSLYDNAKLWLYYYMKMHDKKDLPYEYSEILISKEKTDIMDIYDESLKKELLNIREHSIKEADNGVMAHYFVSAGSYNAATEMIKALALELYNAGRITTKRINVVSDMAPNLYGRDSTFEDMIENSYGGMVVFYLKEKLGFRSSSYGLWRITYHGSGLFKWFQYIR